MLDELIAGLIYQPDGRLVKKSTGRLGDTQTAFGYRKVSLDKGSLGRIREFAHRLVWNIHYGAIPEGMVVDHINGDKLDNRIENLRLATKSQNAQNSSKAKGYWFSPREGLFRVQIKLNRKSQHVGFYSSEADAKAAYLAAKKALHTFAAHLQE